MWFPENCAMQTHCPSLRHISKAHVQGPLKCSLNSESHRPGRTESQGEEVLRHKEAFASRRRWNERCRARACEHIVTMSPIPIGWKQKGTIQHLHLSLSPHTCKRFQETPPPGPCPSLGGYRALTSRKVTKVSNPRNPGQRVAIPEIPMSQGLATFWSNGDQEDQDDLMTSPRCQNECQTSFYFFLYWEFSFCCWWLWFILHL